MNRFETFMLWSSVALAAGSGTVYGWMKFLMSTDDPYAVVNHPLQPLMLKIHIVTAPLLVFSIGLIFTRHIVEQWRSGRAAGRISGTVTAAVTVPMVLSGYLIQTATSDAWLWWLTATHLAGGGAYVLMFLAHRTLMQARERRRARIVRDRLQATADAAPADREECA